jgi:hypothetical protein
MRTLLKYTIGCFALAFFLACNKKGDWLDRQSQTVLANEQVMTDPKLIVGLLANYYDRLPSDASLTNRWQQHTSYDDAVWSGGGNSGDEERNSIVNYATNRWGLWDYVLIGISILRWRTWKFMVQISLTPPGNNLMQNSGF